MLCLKAEEFVLPLNLSLHNTSSGSSACCCSSEDVQCCGGGKGTDKDEKACYRFHLEQEVRILQKQLEEEIDLHFALASAVGPNTEYLFFPSKLPNKAQDLLDNISELETTVVKLEKELTSLHFRFSHERNERLLAETHLSSPTSTSGYIPKEHISSLRFAKSNTSEHSQRCSTEKISEQWTVAKEESEIIDLCEESGTMSVKKNSVPKNLWQHPNKLSEAMVRCMRDIYLWLSESSSNSMHGIHHTCEDSYGENTFDPYRVNGKLNWKNNGSYSLAVEVRHMSVGKEELDYAAEALKNFRFLVEQLTEVNPGQMSNSEKLAFWINLYNALIMHAYLAYGVPKSDLKLFSMMQKASYTIGGQVLNAVDIEYLILKMKPPSHRPQIGLVLALHKLKLSEEQKTYSIDAPEPLILFALSSGMYSSPAVKVFTPDNVTEELENSMKDYIQASIGISDKNKLLVPKLLYCFAKDVVEDSLLVDWICRYLTPDQVTIVKDSARQRKHRFLSARSFSIFPFDSSFRYIFLREN